MAHWLKRATRNGTDPNAPKVTSSTRAPTGGAIINTIQSTAAQSACLNAFYPQSHRWGWITWQRPHPLKKQHFTILLLKPILLNPSYNVRRRFVCCARSIINTVTAPSLHHYNLPGSYFRLMDLLAGLEFTWVGEGARGQTTCRQRVEETLMLITTKQI